MNELTTVVTHLGLRVSSLYNWSFLLSDKVILPFTAREFDIWLETRKLAGFDPVALGKWIHPIDEFPCTSLADESFLSRQNFIAKYRASPKVNVFMDAEDEFIRLSAIAKATRDSTLSLALIPDELSLLRDSATFDSPFSAGTLEQIRQVLFPDMDVIPLQSVIRLRQSAYRHEFRAWLDSLPITEPPGHGIPVALLSPLLDLAASVKPKRRQSLLTGIGSNLPTPWGFNPIGIATAIYDAAKEQTKASRFAPQFFLAELREELKGYSDVTDGI